MELEWFSADSHVVMLSCETAFQVIDLGRKGKAAPCGEHTASRWVSSVSCPICPSSETAVQAAPLERWRRWGSFSSSLGFSKAAGGGGQLLTAK